MTRSQSKFTLYLDISRGTRHRDDCNDSSIHFRSVYVRLSRGVSPLFKRPPLSVSIRLSKEISTDCNPFQRILIFGWEEVAIFQFQTLISFYRNKRIITIFNICNSFVEKLLSLFFFFIFTFRVTVLFLANYKLISDINTLLDYSALRYSYIFRGYYTNYWIRQRKNTN